MNIHVYDIIGWIGAIIITIVWIVIFGVIDLNIYDIINKFSFDYINIKNNGSV